MLLFWIDPLPKVTKKIILQNQSEDILHNIYKEKGVIIGILLVLSTLEVRKGFIDTGFRVAPS